MNHIPLPNDYINPGTSQMVTDQPAFKDKTLPYIVRWDTNDEAIGIIRIPLDTMVFLRAEKAEECPLADHVLTANLYIFVITEAEYESYQEMGVLPVLDFDEWLSLEPTASRVG